MVVTVQHPLVEPFFLVNQSFPAINSQPLNSSYTVSNTPTNTSTNTLETSTNTFLQYFLPLITTINTPLSLTNFLVFLKLGFLNSPSNMLYFNLVIVDLLNAVVGIMVSANLWSNEDHQSVEFWRDLEHEVASYISLFTLNTNIVLVFGLCLIRVLWTEMSALHVLRKLKIVSWVIIVLAYLYGFLACSLWHFKSDKKGTGNKLLFPNRTVEAYDIADCAIIFAIVYMSVYTQVRIWLSKSRVDSQIFLSASRASLIITLNVLFSYCFFVAIVATRAYYVVSWNNTFSCPGDNGDDGDTGDNGDTNWTFTDLLLCDELYLSVTFMCFQCTVNSFILLYQKQTRRYLRETGKRCVREVRRFYLEWRGYDPDYDYL